MRLIDADAFLQGEIKRCKCVPLIGSCSKDNENLKEILAGQPTIDPIYAAGVCYCRECKYFDRELQYTKCIAINGLKIATECDFCSYGVRREGEENERID